MYVRMLAFRAKSRKLLSNNLCIISRYNEYQEDNDCVIVDLLRKKSILFFTRKTQIPILNLLPICVQEQENIFGIKRRMLGRWLWHAVEFVQDWTILFGRLSSLCKWFLIRIIYRYRLYGVSRVYGMLNGHCGGPNQLIFFYFYYYQIFLNTNYQYYFLLA